MSRETGMSVNDLMKIFYFNRLAARVFTRDPSGWLIKGGQALLVRYRGAARLSQDIDLQSTNLDLTADDVRQLVIDAATLDLGDFLRYAPTKYTDAAEDGRGGSQYFKVYLGSAEVMTIKSTSSSVARSPGRSKCARLGLPSTSNGPWTGPRFACTRLLTTSPTRSALCTNDMAQAGSTDPIAIATSRTFFSSANRRRSPAKLLSGSAARS